MIMEPMATATNNVREKEERLKFSAGLTGRRNASGGVKRMREDDGEEEGVVHQGAARSDSRPGGGSEQDQTISDVAGAGADAAPSKKKRKKGPSGPNPLSVQKKVKTAGPRGLKVKARAEAAKAAAEEAQSAGVKASSTPGSADASKTRRKRKHTTTSYGASVKA